MPENPLAALGPIAWESLDCTDLGSFLAETFACAQIIADSVPAPASMSSLLVPSSAAPTGRPRSHTDGAVSYNPARLWGRTGSNPATPATSKDDGLPSARERKLHELRQSWKEVVRAGGANNPRDIVVFKMNGGRDGYAGSSWFARRSLHKKTAERAAAGGAPVVIDFETFRRGLLHEFDLEAAAAAENKNKKPTPVRTMVTKRRVEHVVHRSDGTPQGELSIYLLEADFPGPTASRDFVTMLLTTESQHSPSTRFGGVVSRPCRQFMLVSKPCHHPETPARPGFVRAQYESVEMIREVPVPRGEGGAGTRRTRSSIDLGHEQQDTDLNDTHEMAIEWIMITRNNPGGSVPRFLVDKSTPGSIISDANKFLDWLAARAWAAAHTAAAEAAQNANSNSTTAPGTAMSVGGLGAAIHEEEEEEAAAAAAAARRAGGAA